jgi:hypothetical protein
VGQKPMFFHLWIREEFFSKILAVSKKKDTVSNQKGLEFKKNSSFQRIFLCLKKYS